MTRESRAGLIHQIEESRNSRLLVAVWGDRKGLEAQIAFDAQTVFFEHLQRIGTTERIDVLIYSTGGLTLAAWGLANLVREFCREVGVLIPYKAYSSATLFALGANDLVMTRLGQLSPIDPSVTTPLGPTVQVPTAPGQGRVVPVSVEDVVGFLDLARDEAKLQGEDSLRPVFERLASQVHPLALGAVYRSRQQIQGLAGRLLRFHIPDEQNNIRDKIVETLTRGLGSHDYLIGRREAKDELGLNVVEPNRALEGLITDLFNEYSNLLQLNDAYNPEGFLGTSDTKIGDFDRAIIESSELIHVFRTNKRVQRVQVQQQGVTVPGIQEQIYSEGWVEDAVI